VLKSSYYSSAQLGRLRSLAERLKKKEAVLLREASTICCANTSAPDRGSQPSSASSSRIRRRRATGDAAIRSVRLTTSWLSGAVTAARNASASRARAGGESWPVALRTALRTRPSRGATRRRSARAACASSPRAPRRCEALRRRRPAGPDRGSSRRRRWRWSRRSGPNAEERQSVPEALFLLRIASRRLADAIHVARMEPPRRRRPRPRPRTPRRCSGPGARRRDGRAPASPPRHERPVRPRARERTDAERAQLLVLFALARPRLPAQARERRTEEPLDERRERARRAGRQRVCRDPAQLLVGEDEHRAIGLRAQRAQERDVVGGGREAGAHERPIVVQQEEPLGRVDLRQMRQQALAEVAVQPEAVEAGRPGVRMHPRGRRHVGSSSPRLRRGCGSPLPGCAARAGSARARSTAARPGRGRSAAAAPGCPRPRRAARREEGPARDPGPRDAGNILARGIVQRAPEVGPRPRWTRGSDRGTGGRPQGTARRRGRPRACAARPRPSGS